MKTKLMVLMLSAILLTGLVLADILTTTNQTVTLTRQQQTALTSIGITNPTRSPILCDNKICCITLYQKDAINTDICVGLTHWDNLTRQKVNYTDTEIKELIANRTTLRLTQIADDKIIQVVNRTQKDNGGSVNITSLK